MSIKSEAKIYQILERVIRASGDKALTSTELYDIPEIRNNVVDNEDLSDRLGFMWRRGLLQRWYAPKTNASRSRYAYSWKQQDIKPIPVESMHNITTINGGKTSVKISEDERGVVIEFEKFCIIVEPK